MTGPMLHMAVALDGYGWHPQAWRATLAEQPWMAGYSGHPDGTRNPEYGAASKPRFDRWIIDVCTRPLDRDWLDYQHEIGLRDGEILVRCMDRLVVHKGDLKRGFNGQLSRNELVNLRADCLVLRARLVPDDQSSGTAFHKACGIMEGRLR